MRDSPFQFLDAFNKNDKELFFGREKETEELYKMTYESKLILLYGASGTGKTSLVQCGLANRYDKRWKELYIRREYNIIDSIKRKLTEELEDIEEEPNIIDQEKGFVKGLREIQESAFKPLFLIFDQFEELFTQRNDSKEQAEFFDFVKDLIGARFTCKLIFIMREEYLADLSEFEKKVPSLFDFRYRIEKMRFNQIQQITQKMLQRLDEKEELDVDAPDLISEKIRQRLQHGGTGTELTYLQVYLDWLYQQAVKKIEDAPPRFDSKLIDVTGDFDDAIGFFLDSKIEELENRFGKTTPLAVLSELVTHEHTKRIVSEEDLENIRKEYQIDEKDFYELVEELEKMRLIRSYED